MPTTIASGRRIANSGAWASRANGSAFLSTAYLILLNTSDSGVECWSSTDGSSWAEVDSSHSPTATSTTASFSAWRHTDGYIYVAYFSATNTINVRRFNTATNLWETSDLGSGSATTSGNNARPVRVGVRSNGDVIVGFENATPAVQYSRRVGTTWTTNVAVNTVTSRLWDLRIDDADTTYFFYGDDSANDSTYRTLSSGNVLGTETDLDTTAHTTAKPFSSNAAYFSDGTNKKLAVLQRDSTGELDMFSGTQGSTLGSLTTTASISTSTTPQTTSMAVTAYHNALHCLWAEANTVMRDRTISLTTFTMLTTGDVTVLSGLADADVCPQWLKCLGALGVLYQESGNVKVEWVTLPIDVTVAPYPISSSVVNSAAITANTDINVAKPPDWTPAIDDYCVMVVGSRATADSTFQVAGGDGTWTELTHSFKTSSGPSVAIWAKRLGSAGSEPTNYTYQFNQSAQTFAIFGAFRNVATSSEVDVTGTPQSGNSTTATQSATTSVADDLAIFATGYGASTSSTKTSDPTGYSNYQHNTSQMRGSLDAGLIASATTTSPTETNSAAENWATVLVALSPPGSGATPVTGTDSSAITGTDAAALALTATVSDSSTVTGSDVSALARSSSVTDSSAIVGTDTSSLVIVTSVAVTDTGTISSSDAATNLLTFAPTDTGTITSADAGTLAITASRPDSSAIVGTDVSATSATTPASDTSAIAGAEASALSVTLAVTDTSAVASTDASTLTTVNLIAVTDSSAIAGADASTLTTVDLKAASDSSAIVGTDTSSRLINQVLTASDSGAVVGTESAAVVVVFTISDAGALAATETALPPATMTRTDSGVLAATENAALGVVLNATDLGALAALETAQRGDVSSAPYEIFTAPAPPGTATIGGDGILTIAADDILTAPDLDLVLTGG